MTRQNNIITQAIDEALKRSDGDSIAALRYLTKRFHLQVRRSDHIIPSADFFKARLSYDPNSGDLRWNSSGRSDRIGEIAGSKKGRYSQIGIEGHYYYSHRIIWLMMTGEWPTKVIDHINGDPRDNRWCNLRLATKADNMRNRGAWKHKKSGLPCGSIR